MAVVKTWHKDFNEAQQWHDAIAEVSGILDNQEYDKWKIADLLADLIPDGDPDIHFKLQQFADGIGGRLKKSTLTSYRRAALRFPASKRTGEKPFWYYAQAAWHQNAEEIVAQATSEYELRQLLGGRDPYRVRNSRVQDALRDLPTARDLLQPDLIHLWLNDDKIRQRFIDELRTSHGFKDVQVQADELLLAEVEDEIGVRVFA